MDSGNVIGAFSEESAEQLTGVSVGQMRRWARMGLMRPSYANERHVPYGRVYSFRDLVSLRVLNELRNRHGISIAHLITVHNDLSRLSDAPWSAARLEVLGKRVVIREPNSDVRRVAGSRQLVLSHILLPVVISGLRQAVERLNERQADTVGKIDRPKKFVAENQPVISGTRIPVSAVKSFASAGYNARMIIKEYPDLSEADIEAAIAYESGPAAA